MDFTPLIILLLIVLAGLAALLFMRRVTIFEYQRGLLYRQGKFVSLLQPGSHVIFRPIHTVYKVDMRTVNVTIPAQEVLSADNVSLKVTIAASYQIADPYLALNQVANYQESLYLHLQLNLRDLVGSLEIDELLAQRAEIGRQLFERTTAKAAEIGLELLLANVKDIMFPGELKTIFAQVVNARKEGLAALERARGETAALRNLTNAAGLFENNPNLRQLRLFQVLEKSAGNTVVFLPSDGTARQIVDQTEK